MAWSLLLLPVPPGTSDVLAFREELKRAVLRPIPGTTHSLIQRLLCRRLQACQLHAWEFRFTGFRSPDQATVALNIQLMARAV